MSKRGQEQNFGEGSATAKPKPMSLVQAEARPRRSLMCQVSHCSSRWSERSSSTTALSNPENPWKALTQMSDVDRSSRKPFEHDCDTSDNECQASSSEKVGKCSDHKKTWKQAKVIPSDGSFRKQSSNAVRITDSDYISKIFRFLQNRLGIQEGRDPFSVQASKTQQNDVGIDHVFVDEGSTPSWTELREESGDLQVHEL